MSFSPNILAHNIYMYQKPKQYLIFDLWSFVVLYLERTKNPQLQRVSDGIEGLKNDAETRIGDKERVDKMKQSISPNVYDLIQKEKFDFIPLIDVYVNDVDGTVFYDQTIQIPYSIMKEVPTIDKERMQQIMYRMIYGNETKEKMTIFFKKNSNIKDDILIDKIFSCVLGSALSSFYESCHNSSLPPCLSLVEFVRLVTHMHTYLYRVEVDQSKVDVLYPIHTNIIKGGFDSMHSELMRIHKQTKERLYKIMKCTENFTNIENNDLHQRLNNFINAKGEVTSQKIFKLLNSVQYVYQDKEDIRADGQMVDLLEEHCNRVIPNIDFLLKIHNKILGELSNESLYIQYDNEANKVVHDLIRTLSTLPEYIDLLKELDTFVRSTLANFVITHDLTPVQEREIRKIHDNLKRINLNSEVAKSNENLRVAKSIVSSINATTYNRTRGNNRKELTFVCRKALNQFLILFMQHVIPGRNDDVEV